jgi:hypothetical protein
LTINLAVFSTFGKTGEEFMTYLNRHWMSLRALISSYNSVRVSALLIGLQCAGAHLSIAAPVTFRFESEVASVLPNRGGADLPFDVSEGDSLVTTFSFEPASGGPEYPQSGLIQFAINGHVLAISGYNISVQDNELTSGLARGRIADPIHAPIDDDPGGSRDNIFLGCLPHSTPEEFFCGSLTINPAIVFRPTVGLSNEDDLISSDKLSTDLAIWNQFSFREMSLSFVNTITNGETYVGAFVGSVKLVPEPGTILLVLVTATTWAGYSSRRRWSLRQTCERCPSAPQVRLI